jgi:UDP-N-acetylglucosamine--dolichyl-phosphate N-acetylglucosaminephosphotransferase
LGKVFLLLKKIKFMFPWFLPVIAFVATLVLTPILGEAFKKKGIIGRDLHKEGNPLVPELVGAAVLASFTVSLLGAYLYLHENSFLVTAAIVLLVGIMGILDHYRPLTPREKVLGLGLVGLLYYALSPPQGYAYLILVPVLFMVACNFTNMLAGLNGLEVGVGAIASLGVASAAYLNGSLESLVTASTMGAALLAFLLYNRYPARVFPGDVGTLIIGAALFASIHMGGLYIAGAIIFLPYAVDAGLKFVSAGVMSRHGQKPTIMKNGKLYSPPGGNLSLVRLLLRVKPMGEREVVVMIWGIEAFFVTVAIAAEVVL